MLRDGCVDGGPGSRSRVFGEFAAHGDILGDRQIVKRNVRRQRLPLARADHDLDQQLVLDAIPIVVHDRAPAIHYPATINDLRAVVDGLPPDILLGVRTIEYRLWPTYRYPGHTHGPFPVVPDPIYGRRSVKALGGVWVAPNLATYRPRTGHIYLHAYVIDPAWPDAAELTAVLKLTMLTSFVHELAHHDDHRRRTARGRWCLLDVGRAEAYAESVADHWRETVVLPYILQQYPAEVEQASGWVASLVDRPDMIQSLTECPFFGQLRQLLDARRHSEAQPASRSHRTGDQTVT